MDHNFVYQTFFVLLFCFLLLILRSFVEAVDDVRHDVAGKGVAVGFGAALGVENLGDVAEVAEDVEGIEGEGEASFLSTT